MSLSRIVQRNEKRLAEKRRRTQLTLALFTVVIVVVLAITFWPRPPYIPEVTGRANLAIDQTMLDLGTQHWDTSVTAEFNIRNTGDLELRILNDPQVRVVTGCCPPPVELAKKALQPGEEVTLSLTFMMHEGMDGLHDFRVMLETNDPLHPQQELTIASNWVQ